MLMASQILLGPGDAAEKSAPMLVVQRSYLVLLSKNSSMAGAKLESGTWKEAVLRMTACFCFDFDSCFQRWL